MTRIYGTEIDDDFKTIFDGIEEKPKDCKRMGPETIQLYLFCDKIFARSKEFLSHLSYLNKKRSNKNNAQCTPFDKKICNVLENNLIIFLKKLNICKLTYTELLTLESLRDVAIETFEAFSIFLERSFPTIEEIFKRCHEKQILTFSDESLIEDELRIDSETKRFIKCLQNHFNYIYQLKLISDDSYQEKLKEISIRLNSFCEKVLEKYCESNSETHTYFAEDLLIEKRENMEKKHLPENYTRMNVESDAIKKPTLNEFTSKHNNAVENFKNDTVDILHIGRYVSIFIFLTVLSAFIGWYLGKKRRKPTNKEIEEDHKLIEDKSKDQ